MLSSTARTGWITLALVGGMIGSLTGAVASAETAAPANGARADVSSLSKLIDQAIEKRLSDAEVRPSPRAGDAEFLRRVYLDITGVIPPASKVAAFLDSKDPNKRALLIDELLASPLYGRHMADIWQALILPRNSDNRRLSAEPLVKWLEQGFNENKPWDRFVSDLITATGSADENGAVTFFLANPTPDKLTDLSSKLFLGVRLGCAQCHNHPFTGWKQAEYWGMAAFFTRVKMKGNPKNAGKKGVTPEISEGGQGKPVRLPQSAKVVPAKFFKGEQPQLKASEPYRPVLARWMTAPDNPFFARAMVNRMWQHLFGHGFVQPVDDMHEANEVSHPELLKELSAQFAAGGFDLKHLVRAICNSNAYQRTSKPIGDNEEDDKLFSHMAVKTMSPEQLFDSLAEVLGNPDRAQAQRRKAQQQQQQAGRPGSNPRAAFVAFFQGDDDASPTEYQSGVPQALRLMNSPQLRGGNLPVLNDAARPAKTPAQVFEHLYLTTLSRRPTADEQKRLGAYAGKAGDARTAYGDVLWALLNSSEFVLNH